MNQLGVNFRILMNWLPAICELRNSCAHHHRFYNRWFDTLLYPKNRGDHIFIADSALLPKNRLFYHCCCLFFLVDRIHPHTPYRSLKNDFRSILIEFAKRAPSRLTYHTHLGIPNDWQDDPFWSITH